MAPASPHCRTAPQRCPAGAAAAACALALLWLAGPAGAVELGEGFRPVTDDGAGPAALHGSLLAWLGADRVLRLSDLANGTVRTLTALPEGARMQSLAFDGTWVAWCDNRFADQEAFAMDVRQLSLVRLSRHPAPDTDITVGGGHVAWLHDDAVVGTDLDAPAMRRLSDLPGLAFTPVLDGDRLVWSQVAGAGRHLAGLVWGGNATLLTSDPRSLDTSPTLSGNRLAWQADVYSGPVGSPGSKSLGTRIQDAVLGPRLVSLRPHNVTSLGPHERPVLGGSWLVWLEAGRGGGLVAVSLADGQTFQAMAPLAGALASESYLVVRPSDGTALQARSWTGADKESALPASPLLAAALLGLAWVARRRA